MEISASLVKDLREKTGAGMMDCKKALVETQGNFDAAVDYLRKKGIASAAKKAGRATKEGLVASFLHPEGKLGVVLEINCETDFVSRTEQFKQFISMVGNHILVANPSTVEELANQPIAAAGGKTPSLLLQETIATLGENMSIRRFARFAAADGGKGLIASYIHGEGKVGVLVDVSVGNPAAAHGEALKAFAKDLTMHIAAAAPQWLNASDVPAEVTTKEKEIALAQIQNSGKAMKPEFMEKAVEGRVRKVLEETCLMSQPFVKDPNKTIAQLIKETDAAVGGGLSVRRFARFMLGEGLKDAAEEGAAN
ncbi:MAG: elongation factor Ts [Bdellovibrionales bacterium]|nr:elongation factor Ts [Bdellovibrionales bacterium]